MYKNILIFIYKNILHIVKILVENVNFLHISTISKPKVLRGLYLKEEKCYITIHYKYICGI